MPQYFIIFIFLLFPIFINNLPINDSGEESHHLIFKRVRRQGGMELGDMDIGQMMGGGGGKGKGGATGGGGGGGLLGGDDDDLGLGGGGGSAGGGKGGNRRRIQQFSKTNFKDISHTRIKQFSQHKSTIAIFK